MHHIAKAIYIDANEQQYRICIILRTSFWLQAARHLLSLSDPTECNYGESVFSKLSMLTKAITMLKTLTWCSSSSLIWSPFRGTVPRHPVSHFKDYHLINKNMNDNINIYRYCIMSRVCSWFPPQLLSQLRSVRGYRVLQMDVPWVHGYDRGYFVLFLHKIGETQLVIITCN